MNNPTSLIVEATGAYYVDDLEEGVSDVKQSVKRFMNTYGYVQEDTLHPLHAGNFLSMKFNMSVSDPSVSLLKKLNIQLNPFNDEKLSQYKFNKSYNKIRKDLPFEVVITLDSMDEIEANAVRIDVRCEPVAYHSYKRNFHSLDNLSNPERDVIVDENKKFIETLIKGIGSTFVNQPQSRGLTVQNQLYDELELYEFDKIKNLLEEGRERIEYGDVKEGLTNLREAHNQFFIELIKKSDSIESDPKGKLKENIKLIQENDITSDRISKFNHMALYQWLYSYLSDKPVHGREDIDLIDANYLFDLAEQSMEFYLKKTLKGV